MCVLSSIFSKIEGKRHPGPEWVRFVIRHISATNALMGGDFFWRLSGKAYPRFGCRSRAADSCLHCVCVSSAYTVRRVLGPTYLFLFYFSEV